MARTDGLSEYEKFMKSDFDKQFNTPVYCQICGREIMLTGNVTEVDLPINTGMLQGKKASTYDADTVKGNVHQDCLNAYNKEKARKAAEEAMRKREEEIRKAREEEDKKLNGGQ